MLIIPFAVWILCHQHVLQDGIVSVWGLAGATEPKARAQAQPLEHLSIVSVTTNQDSMVGFPRVLCWDLQGIYLPLCFRPCSPATNHFCPKRIPIVLQCLKVAMLTMS